MTDLRVRGAEDFLALSKRLKASGQTELRKELNKALKRAAKPLIAKTRDAARSKLPSGGGLGGFIARKPQRITTKTGRNPGVSVGVAKTDPRIDEGRLFHPVFGRRPGVTQRVTPGWFSETLQDEAPAVRDDLIAVLEDIANRAARG